MMRLRGHDELCNFVRFGAFHNAKMSPPLAAASSHRISPLYRSEVSLVLLATHAASGPHLSETAQRRSGTRFCCHPVRPAPAGEGPPSLLATPVGRTQHVIGRTGERPTLK